MLLQTGWDWPSRAVTLRASPRLDGCPASPATFKATTAQTSPAFGRSYVVASPTDVFSLVGLGLSVDLRARLSRPLSPLASPGSGSATSWGSSLASMQAGVSEVRGGRAPSMDATLEEPLRPAGTSRVYSMVMASPPSCLRPQLCL